MASCSSFPRDASFTGAWTKLVRKQPRGFSAAVVAAVAAVPVRAVVQDQAVTVACTDLVVLAGKAIVWMVVSMAVLSVARGFASVFVVGYVGGVEVTVTASSGGVGFLSFHSEDVDSSGGLLSSGTGLSGG